MEASLFPGLLRYPWLLLLVRVGLLRQHSLPQLLRLWPVVVVAQLPNLLSATGILRPAQ